jgi:hypothetical protein
MTINVNPYRKSNIGGLLELATVIHTYSRSTYHEFIFRYSVSLVMPPVTFVFETPRSLAVMSGDTHRDISYLSFPIECRIFL